MSFPQKQLVCRPCQLTLPMAKARGFFLQRPNLLPLCAEEKVGPFIPADNQSGAFWAVNCKALCHAQPSGDLSTEYIKCVGVY